MATCNGAGEGRLEGLLFRIVVLDEASQATEASRCAAPGGGQQHRIV